MLKMPSIVKENIRNLHLRKIAGPGVLIMNLNAPCIKGSLILKSDSPKPHSMLTSALPRLAKALLKLTRAPHRLTWATLQLTSRLVILQKVIKEIATKAIMADSDTL